MSLFHKANLVLLGVALQNWMQLSNPFILACLAILILAETTFYKIKK